MGNGKRRKGIGTVQKGQATFQRALGGVGASGSKGSAFEDGIELGSALLQGAASVDSMIEMTDMALDSDDADENNSEAKRIQQMASTSAMLDMFDKHEAPAATTTATRATSPQPSAPNPSQHAKDRAFAIKAMDAYESARTAGPAHEPTAKRYLQAATLAMKALKATPELEAKYRKDAKRAMTAADDMKGQISASREGIEMTSFNKDPKPLAQQNTPQPTRSHQKPKTPPAEQTRASHPKAQAKKPNNAEAFFTMMGNFAKNVYKAVKSISNILAKGLYDLGSAITTTTKSSDNKGIDTETRAANTAAYKDATTNLPPEARSANAEAAAAKGIKVTVTEGPTIVSEGKLGPNASGEMPRQENIGAPSSSGAPSPFQSTSSSNNKGASAKNDGPAPGI